MWQVSIVVQHKPSQFPSRVWLHLAKLFSFDGKYQFLFVFCEGLASLKLFCFPLQPVRQKELGGGVGQKFEEKSQSFCNIGEKVLKTIFRFNRTAKEWVKSGNLENEPNKLFVLILTCTWIPVFKHFRNLSAISFCQQNLTCFYRSELFSAIWQRYGFSTENSGFYLLPIHPRPAFASSMGSAWWVSATDVLDWLHTQFFPFCYFQVRSSNKKHLKLLLLHGWPSTSCYCSLLV